MLEFGEGHRAVVLGCREPEPVFDEVLLAGPVAAEHGVDLRQRHVALVHDQQVILREVVDQAEGARAGGASVEVARVVLDSGAVAQLLDHLEVVFDALLDALCLHHASGPLEVFDLLAQVEVDLLHGRVDALLGGDEEVRGVEREVVERVDALTRHGVYGVDGLDLVVEEHHAETLVAELPEGGHDIDRVAVHAEGRGFQLAFGARVERLDELVEEVFVADHLPDLDVDRRGVEVRGVAASVEARDARHDDYVAASREQRGHGVEPHLLDLGIDREVLLDIGVRGREVGLRLVIVVVGDEILDGVVGKEVAELAVELCGEGLVVAQDECRAVEFGDDVGHREGLSRTRHAQQRVVLRAVADRADELRNSLRLVARRGVIGYEFEIHDTKIRFFIGITANGAGAVPI